MDGRLRALAIRSTFLFLLSLVLVAGFWYHREFYQIGFTNLLIIGGFVTFLVIWAARLAMTGELPRGRPSGELAFTLEEGDLLLKRVARSVVRPSEDLTAPSVGHVVRAKYETGTEFARLLIEDARRTFLSDLTDDDARQAGFRSAADLREAGTSSWSWRPADIVTILRVRALGGSRCTSRASSSSWALPRMSGSSSSLPFVAADRGSHRPSRPVRCRSPSSSPRPRSGSLASSRRCGR